MILGLIQYRKLVWSIMLVLMTNYLRMELIQFFFGRIKK